METIQIKSTWIRGQNTTLHRLPNRIIIISPTTTIISRAFISSWRNKIWASPLSSTNSKSTLLRKQFISTKSCKPTINHKIAISLAITMMLSKSRAKNHKNQDPLAINTMNRRVGRHITLSRPLCDYHKEELNQHLCLSWHLHALLEAPFQFQ